MIYSNPISAKQAQSHQHKVSDPERIFEANETASFRSHPAILIDPRNIGFVVGEDGLEKNRTVNLGGENKFEVYEVCPVNFDIAIRSDPTNWYTAQSVPSKLMKYFGAEYFNQFLADQFHRTSKPFQVYDAFNEEMFDCTIFFWGFSADLLARHAIYAMSVRKNSPELHAKPNIVIAKLQYQYYP